MLGQAFRRAPGVLGDFGRDRVCPSRLPRCVRVELVVAEVTWSRSGRVREVSGECRWCPRILGSRVGEPDPGRAWWAAGFGLVDWASGMDLGSDFRSDLYSF